MTRLIHVTAVMLAAAASMAGFSQVIGPVLPYLSRWAVITAAAGFVGVSLTMGHFAGQMLRDRLEGPQVVPAGRIALIALAWLALGATGFCCPLAVGRSWSFHVTALGAAVIFAVLYATAGTVVTYSAFITRDCRRGSPAPEGDRKAAGIPVGHVRRRYGDDAAQKITGLAARLAGRRRPDVLEEWRAHLAEEMADRRGSGSRAAAGFLVAAIRYRLSDAADAAWRPAEAILRSRTLSNLLVIAPTAAAAALIAREKGMLGVLTSAENVSAIAGGLYGLVRLGRWWRNVKPAEPKARRKDP
jgi:hypothetical protein